SAAATAGTAAIAATVAAATGATASATAERAARGARATAPARGATRSVAEEHPPLLAEDHHQGVEHGHELTVLDSGVRVVTERMQSVRSVALGLWIGTGSAAEDEPEAGLSHLIEHMLFRGTARYRSLEIDQLFDAMGAELNAGTGKETTSVYSRVLDVHLAEAFDVMADMVWRPRFDADELAQEREIILEEIAMYEDDPQEKVFDVLGEAVFGDHPLGRAIIGRAPVIAETPASQIAAFHHSRYAPSNVVIAAAGAIEHEAIVELAAKHVGDGIGSDG